MLFNGRILCIPCMIIVTACGSIDDHKDLSFEIVLEEDRNRYEGSVTVYQEISNDFSSTYTTEVEILPIQGKSLEIGYRSSSAVCYVGVDAVNYVPQIYSCEYISKHKSVFLYAKPEEKDSVVTGLNLLHKRCPEFERFYGLAIDDGYPAIKDKHVSDIWLEHIDGQLYIFARNKFQIGGLDGAVFSFKITNGKLFSKISLSEKEFSRIFFLKMNTNTV